MGHPQIALSVVSRGRHALGKGGIRPDSLIVVMNCGHSWCLHGSRVLCCQVISHVRCILIQIYVTLSDMSVDLPPHPNVVNELHLCLYMSYEMDVDGNYLYQMLFDNTCMLSICCKPMMLSTLIWLKLD
jgi:hypothetical protein